MNLTKAQFRSHLPWAIFVVIVLMVFWDLIFMGFIHYHSQNRVLRPADYNILVVTEDDYRLLKDSSQTTVHLADGTILKKAAAWDASNFKPIQGGKMYTQVTTKGTAHILDQALPMPVFVLFLGIMGIIATCPRTCRAEQTAEQRDEARRSADPHL